MLIEGLPVPFELGPGMTRIDDTPQHKAVREALTNMLVHADYYGRAGLVALRTSEGIDLANPGTLRLPLDVIEGGGVSDPRNLTMLTMFNLIGMGDKAGSGFDVLRRSAEWAGVDAPTLTESLDPDRVVLTLPLATGGLSLAVNGKRAAGERRPAETGEDVAETGEDWITDRRRPTKMGLRIGAMDRMGALRSLQSSPISGSMRRHRLSSCPACWNSVPHARARSSPGWSRRVFVALGQNIFDPIRTDGQGLTDGTR